MGLIDPDAIRQLRANALADKKSSEAEVRREVAENKKIRERAKKETSIILKEALKLACSGDRETILDKAPSELARSLLEQHGFRIAWMAEELASTNKKLDIAVKKYKDSLIAIKKSLRVWISVSMRGKFSPEEIDSEIIPLLFVDIDKKSDHKMIDFDWNGAIATLEKWSDFSEPSKEAATLVENDEAFYRLNVLLDGMSFNTTRLEILSRLSKESLELALEVNKLEPTENFFDETLVEIYEAENASILSWDVSLDSFPETREKVSAWTFCWLSSAAGNRFLEKLEISLTNAALGLQDLVLIAPETIEQHEKYIPDIGELAETLKIAGYNAKSLNSSLEIKLDDQG